MKTYGCAKEAMGFLSWLGCLSMLVVAATGCHWSTSGTAFAPSTRSAGGPSLHVWEKVEITLAAKAKYQNPYTDVVVWVDLKGPAFEKRCYGFWDGGNTFRVRVLATAPGGWNWRSGSLPADPGLTGLTGAFSAPHSTDTLRKTHTRPRGVIRPSAHGVASQYAPGTPFFPGGV